ncbi:MAG: EAL domain-containing protein [Acetobacteraceae bacterium]|nr:EAL domain-containing protein [Acetobacteraceae bacterium]
MPQILILDDRVTNQRILARLAASVEPDVKVSAFGDPLDALAWLETHEADLVITDFKMPHLDGAEVTRRIRRMPHGADVPVVVVTVYDDREFRLLALDAGATDFLLAPVDHVEFRTRVRNLLALRRHQLEARRQAERLRQDLEASERLRVALMQESREALAQLIDTLPAMISAADAAGRVVFVNARQAALAGRPPAQLIGQDVELLFGAERAAFGRELDAEVFARGEALPGFEEGATGPDGTRIELFTTKAPLRDAEGRVVAVLTTSLDITDRKQAEERLLHLAQHDPLTALPNRSYLAERLRERCAQGRRSEDPFALHVLDLDRFKGVNDALGHQAGDRLLAQAARRLRAAVREGDLVARLGGDEFAILQRDAATPADAAHLADRVLSALARPFRLGGHSVATSASLGVTLCPKDATTADELLRNAELAMYRAKATGRNRFGFFDPDMDADAQRALQLEGELRRALARREFELVWQPQVNLRTGRICGAEALLRWRHAARGIVSPAEFLQLAEETGLIAPITEWALAAACAQGVAWQKRRPGGLRVSANLSPSLFGSRDVRDMVVDALATSGLDPSLLDIEITERVLLDKVEEMAATLRSLREIGVSFSIDDFGTGYSSLAHARNFPVQRLKVDQAFIANLPSDRADAAIVGAIVSLAHGLGMDVVAEGVETAEQLAALRRLGCDEVQGYFVREPVTAAELEAMLDADVVLLGAG